MSPQPLVSIITPAYNSEKFIRQTIRSVLDQTYPNWEYIVVDDGSTDTTARIVEEYRRKDSRIHYRFQENQGQAAARNTGLSAATGDLVAFLDHDDLWLPEKLTVSVSEFIGGKQDVLFTDAYIFETDEELKNIAKLPTMHISSATYSGIDGFSFFLYHNLIPMLTVLARREALLAVGGFQPLKIADDYLMWMNLLLSGYVLRGIDMPLSLYRMHPEATSAGDRYGVKDILEILKKFRNQYPDIVDYRPQASQWIALYATTVMTRKDFLSLKQHIIYWDLYTSRIKYLFLFRRFLPFRSFARKVSRALKSRYKK
jgi:glycosyltransferase involved in cell wall biosynthesis